MGVVKLRRNTSWATRYTMIDGAAQMLHYKDNQFDFGWKYSIILYEATIKKVMYEKD